MPNGQFISWSLSPKASRFKRVGRRVEKSQRASHARMLCEAREKTPVLLYFSLSLSSPLAPDFSFDDLENSSPMPKINAAVFADYLIYNIQTSHTAKNRPSVR